MNDLKYLALGDSYTIGEAVSAEDRWPHLLVKKLKEKDVFFNPPEIIAVTGWTTAELKEGISKKKPESNYDLVSLLIGVNNQYRDYDIEVYKKEFLQLLEYAIHFANNKKEHVFVVSIPDYGVTPFAVEKDPEKIALEIDEYNSIAKTICQSIEIPFIDITQVSKQAKSDMEMNASDGLHPTGKMYKLWTDEIFPVVQSKFS